MLRDEDSTFRVFFNYDEKEELWNCIIERHATRLLQYVHH